MQIDDGPWQQTRLAHDPSPDLWRQWTYRWDATPGRHTLCPRATDATGTAQTVPRVPPFPDGATGWHTVTVT
ncbi:hypothetical protein [Micromonospora endolithica]|uniref:hypothetical protein n=1 Tax=Micromonospora endolithica TaxID=230091 RepID=UPI0011ADC746|nr:hypothetical protein [Micromonospora endolithica]TWJ25179.1 hypothetical protein JD76_05342 [Micromonospora endolithica]